MKRPRIGYLTEFDLSDMKKAPSQLAPDAGVMPEVQQAIDPRQGDIETLGERRPADAFRLHDAVGSDLRGGDCMRSDGIGAAGSGSGGRRTDYRARLSSGGPFFNIPLNSSRTADFPRVVAAA